MFIVGNETLGEHKTSSRVERHAKIMTHIQKPLEDLNGGPRAVGSEIGGWGRALGKHQCVGASVCSPLRDPVMSAAQSCQSRYLGNSEQLPHTVSGVL